MESKTTGGGAVSTQPWKGGVRSEGGGSRKEDAESQGLFECRAALKLSKPSSKEAAQTSCRLSWGGCAALFTVCVGQQSQKDF